MQHTCNRVRLFTCGDDGECDGQRLVDVQRGARGGRGGGDGGLAMAKCRCDIHAAA